MKRTKKEIKKRIDRQCVICSKAIKVIVYQDKTYRGGHYFDFDKLIGGEYWECPKCYWKGKNDF